jgi:hypothetical protein
VLTSDWIESMSDRIKINFVIPHEQDYLLRRNLNDAACDRAVEAF